MNRYLDVTIAIKLDIRKIANRSPTTTDPTSQNAPARLYCPRTSKIEYFGTYLGTRKCTFRCTYILRGVSPQTHTTSRTGNDSPLTGTGRLRARASCQVSADRISQRASVPLGWPRDWSPPLRRRQHSHRRTANGDHRRSALARFGAWPSHLDRQRAGCVDPKQYVHVATCHSATCAGGPPPLSHEDTQACRRSLPLAYKRGFERRVE